ncbi:MAG: oligosaccharide flippase family protein [Candidatus Nanopelagicales bacterium]
MTHLDATARMRAVTRTTTFRAAFQLIQGNVVARLAVALAGLLAARELGLREFGAFSYGLATAALLAGIGQMGLPALLTRDVAQSTSRRERGETLSGGVLFVGVMAGLTSILGLVIVWSVASPDFEDLLAPGGWFGIGSYAFTTAVNSILFSYLHGSSDFSGWRRFSVIRAVLNTTAILLALVLSGTATACLLAIGLSEAMVTLVLLWSLRADFRRLGSEVRRAFLSRLRTTLGPASASVAILLSSWAMQTLLLSQPGGLDQTGAYGLATRVALLGMFIPAAYVGAIMPRILAPDGPDARAFERRSERAALGFAALGGVGTLAAILLLPILGSEYVAAVPALAVLSVGILPTIGNTFAGQTALARHLTRAWWLSDCWLAAAIAGVGVLAVPAWGAAGLAVASLFAYLTSWLGLRFWVGRYDAKRPHDDGRDEPDVDQELRDEFQGGS